MRWETDVRQEERVSLKGQSSGKGDEKGKGKRRRKGFFADEAQTTRDEKARGKGETKCDLLGRMCQFAAENSQNVGATIADAASSQGRRQCCELHYYF